MKEFLGLGLTEQAAGAAEKLGFQVPTEIQQQAVPRVLAGVNLVGQAPTGTGKTMAYLLPLLQRVEGENSSVQSVVLAPTYELAMQISGELTKLIEAGDFGVRTQALIGGANMARQIDKLKKKPQIVVGSAGRLLELLRKGKLKLQQVKCLVLDEFDRLLDDQNQQAVAELVKALPGHTQYLLFSATAPKKALERAGFLADPEIIQVKEGLAEPSSIENYYVIAPFRDKIETMRKLTRTLPVKRGLVFINRVFDAEKTLEKLRFDGIRADSLLGSANKMARKNAIAGFRKGQVQLLLATDIAARGLDIEGIDYVFNLDLPDTAQIYLHRAGRTGRAGAAGTVITLADIREAYKLEQLERRLEVKFKPLKKAAGSRLKEQKKVPQKRRKV